VSRQRVRCRAHCPACGGHFTSDAAFDAHREGSHRDGERRCLEPEGVPCLRVVTDSGRCEIHSPNAEGIELREHGRQVDAARERHSGRPLPGARLIPTGHESLRRPPPPGSSG